MGLFDFLKKKELEEIANLRIELDRFKPINDIEAEVTKRRNEIEALVSTKENELNNLKNDFAKVKTDYSNALETYTKIRKELSLYENKLDLIEFGVYEPIYEFDKSDEYRQEQNKIIELQKEMISSERAAICRTNWTIDGSEAKGKASTKKYIKLTLRAFNGECESLIAKVKWNNVNQMKERITKSFETINKIGESQTVSIQPEYLDLKIKELVLEYEYQLKKQNEREELRAAQEALREEEKARREYEQAQKEAEKEEANYQKALEKARKEIESTTGEKHDQLQAQIAKLEQELKEAHERKERALSMAQQTKRGHVYIISNIGSFGEQVYKIGMTRRLEPEDRIKELGDASVPFQFDIHAMVFSEDAPSLENELHKAFANRKVNLLNFKKEFFKVTLEEIEIKVKSLGLECEFIRVPEAMEYRETLAILAKANSSEPEKTIEELIESEFPTSL
jgi:phage-related minor tail protein